MNRNQQTHMGPSDACYYADHRGCPFPTMCECSCHKSLAGDSTPPATPVEPPDKWQFAQELMLDRRNIQAGDECDRCGGWGVTTYGNTATWLGGIGGSTITDDVCDRCWGSGNRHKPWPSRRASHPPAVSGEGERLKELEVLEYQIAGGGPFDREDVRLVRRRNRDGVSKWAVVNRGAALNADGEWEWEPIPSSRTDEYLARTRFATPEAALNVYRLRASTPTPGAPR